MFCLISFSSPIPAFQTCNTVEKDERVKIFTTLMLSFFPAKLTKAQRKLKFWTKNSSGQHTA